MKIKMYQIDAFTDKVFGGNPAAVCILDEFLEGVILQKIAAENNLAETAFVVKKESDFEIRWFTPLVEVELCGHATLAAAYVLYEYYGYSLDTVRFYSNVHGVLTVRKTNDYLTLIFPTDIYKKIDTPSVLVDAFKQSPIEAYKGQTDYLLIFSSQEDIENFRPDLGLIKSAGGRGVIVSAKGNQTDFVSRFFGPQVGIDEDPVTGSAHTTLIPVWAKKLNKNKLTAKQLSARQGDLVCKYLGDYVEISGKAVTYLIGEIDI